MTALAPRPAAASTAIERYTPSRYRLRPRNAIAVLCGGGETFPAMLTAIAAARRSICLEIYVFDDDRIGTRIGAALMERARAGVAVRIIYDSLGGLGMARSFLAALRDAGIELVEFHPVAPWRARVNLVQRTHRKILVIDEEIGFTGGLNLCDAHAEIADGGIGWHDMHCQLRGPVVSDLGRLFHRTWIAEGGAPYPAPPVGDDAIAAVWPDAVAARVVDNANRRRRGAIRAAYLSAIAAAERSIRIENAYFLPDRAVRRALTDAAARGVKVSVIVPGTSNIKPIEYAGLFLAQRLAARGVEILRWQGPMMHAKTAVVDGTWVCIGSYNFDARSLHYNLEVIVEIIDGEVGAALDRRFELDRANTRTFDVAAWNGMAWWRRALAWGAAQFRRWL